MKKLLKWLGLISLAQHDREIERLKAYSVRLAKAARAKGLRVILPGENPKNDYFGGEIWLVSDQVIFTDCCFQATLFREPPWPTRRVFVSCNFSIDSDVLREGGR